MRQGKDELAEEQFKKALEIKPYYVDSMINLSVLALRRRDTKRAIELCEKAVELAPRNPEAHNNLGKALYQEGRLRAAAKAFLEALASPLCDHPEIQHLNLGFCYSRMRQLDKAAESFQNAIRINEGFAYAYYCLAQIRYRQERYAEAWKLVERAQELGYKVPEHFIERLGKAAPRPK
jgi:type IV pilus biogenesis/stability protein PilW